MLCSEIAVVLHLWANNLFDIILWLLLYQIINFESTTSPQCEWHLDYGPPNLSVCSLSLRHVFNFVCVCCAVLCPHFWSSSPLIVVLSFSHEMFITRFVSSIDCHWIVCTQNKKLLKHSFYYDFYSLHSIAIQWVVQCLIGIIYIDPVPHNCISHPQ